MFKRAFYVIVHSMTSRYGYEEKCELRETRKPDYWTFSPTFDHHEYGPIGDRLGDVMVFEHRDAADRQYKYTVNTYCCSEDSNATLRFVRAYTKSGAAKIAFKRGGEIIAAHHNSDSDDYAESNR